jgi:hypothetical protein
MNMKFFVVSFCLLAFACAATAEAGKKGGSSGGKGRGENATGITTLLTQGDSTDKGVFSDLWEPVSGPENLRYVDHRLDGHQDPDGGPGDTLVGDCVAVVVPVEDGVDQGKAQLFIPAPADCVPARRTLIRGSGYDLDQSDPGTNISSDDEFVYHRFRCPDVFAKGTVATTECSMVIAEVDSNGDFIDSSSRAWIIEWTAALVFKDENLPDIRVVAGTDADIYELVAPDKGNGKKSKEHRDYIPLPIRIRFERITIPSE